MVRAVHAHFRATFPFLRGARSPRHHPWPRLAQSSIVVANVTSVNFCVFISSSRRRRRVGAADQGLAAVQPRRCHHHIRAPLQRLVRRCHCPVTGRARVVKWWYVNVVNDATTVVVAAQLRWRGRVFVPVQPHLCGWVRVCDAGSPHQQFASRTACRRCGAAKPGVASPIAASPAAAAAGVRPGDWRCACGDVVVRAIAVAGVRDHLCVVNAAAVSPCVPIQPLILRTSSALVHRAAHVVPLDLRERSQSLPRLCPQWQRQRQQQ